MLLERKPSPSAAIIAAAIVAIAGSVLTILMISLTIFSLLVLGAGGNSQLPSSVRMISSLFLFMFLGLAIYGVVAGVGLIRLKNWARYSALAWAGVMAVFSAIGIIAVSFVPLPTQPNLPANATAIMRWIIVSVYGVPLLVGVWWLALFNRPLVKQQFIGDVTAPDPNIPAKPRGPLPITVLGWFFVVSLAITIPWLFLWPARMPTLILGYAIPGLPGKTILLLFLLLNGLVGYGLLKLKTWGYTLAIGMQCFGLANSLAGLLNPHARSAVTTTVREMNESMQLPSSATVPDMTGFMSMGMSIGIAFVAGVLVLLLYYRKRFRAAAEQSPS